MKYTLDTDFSSLNGPKAANWIMGFQDMVENAFADSSSHSRLLGNLLQDVDFAEIEEMLNMLADAFIDLTDTPLPSNKAADVMNAQEQVYQTPLFRQFTERIQSGLKTALSAVPEQYQALREEYRRYTILPERYAARLLVF